MKNKKRKIKHFCRLYKYVCAICGKERHKRHFVQEGEVCATCERNRVPENQGSLFEDKKLSTG